MAAGCDIALHCKGDLAEMVVVAGAAGDMGPATLSRAQVALAARRPPELVDIAELRRDLSAMLADAPHD